MNRTPYDRPQTVAPLKFTLHPNAPTPFERKFPPPPLMIEPEPVDLGEIRARQKFEIRATSKNGDPAVVIAARIDEPLITVCLRLQEMGWKVIRPAKEPTSRGGARTKAQQEALYRQTGRRLTKRV